MDLGSSLCFARQNRYFGTSKIRDFLVQKSIFGRKTRKSIKCAHWPSFWEKSAVFRGFLRPFLGGSPGTPKKGLRTRKSGRFLTRNRLSDPKIVIFGRKTGISIKCAHWPSFWEKSAIFRGFLGGPQGPPGNPENRPDFSQKSGGKVDF